MFFTSPFALQLIEINRKLLSGTVELPPEGERSPSPPPIYDVMGMRCAVLRAALLEYVGDDWQAVLASSRHATAIAAGWAPRACPRSCSPFPWLSLNLFFSPFACY